jgi:predicted metal-dependent enzyme (double-stranded beta helix superfamily)
MKDALIALSHQRELFLTEEFAPPVRGQFKDAVFYKLSEDGDGQHTLYLSAQLPGKSSPAHNHKNWAVLVGVEGVEENRLYSPRPDGTLQVDEAVMVGPGVGVALLGEDIHSIHVHGEGDIPVWQFRLYERALELQTKRVMIDPKTGVAEHFPSNPNVKPA